MGSFGRSRFGGTTTIQLVPLSPILKTMSHMQHNPVSKSNGGRGAAYPEILPRGYIPTTPMMEKDSPKVAFIRKCLKEQHILIRWICIKCDYNNYNDAPICGLCKRPKIDCVRIESNGKPQFDEWKCPQCSQFNYLFRDVCRSCHFHINTQQPKPKEDVSYTPSSSDGWICQRCGTRNHRDASVCQKCSLRYTTNPPNQPINHTQTSVPPDRRINEPVRSLYDNDTSFLKESSVNESNGRFDRSRSRSPRVKPAEPPSYVAYATAGVAAPAVTKPTDYTQYAQSFSREQAIFAKSRGTCSRECPSTCLNNRVYLHNFPTFISPHDIEQWLEQVGELEVLTRQCQRRRHIVIWDNGKGNCDAVAYYLEPRVAHIAAVYLDKSRIGDVEMQVTMPEPGIDQFIDSIPW